MSSEPYGTALKNAQEKAQLRRKGAEEMLGVTAGEFFDVTAWTSDDEGGTQRTFDNDIRVVITANLQPVVRGTDWRFIGDRHKTMHEAMLSAWQACGEKAMQLEKEVPPAKVSMEL